MTAELKVVTLQETNFRDVPATLRAIADAIDADEYGDVVQASIVMQTHQTLVFHLGEGDAADAHLLFACAQRLLESAVLDGGE